MQLYMYLCQPGTPDTRPRARSRQPGARSPPSQVPDPPQPGRCQTPTGGQGPKQRQKRPCCLASASALSRRPRNNSQTAAQPGRTASQQQQRKQTAPPSRLWAIGRRSVARVLAEAHRSLSASLAGPHARRRRITGGSGPPQLSTGKAGGLVPCPDRGLASAPERVRISPSLIALGPAVEPALVWARRVWRR